MNIVEATHAYEAWLAAAIPAPLNQPDLDYKHKRMADSDNPFPFLRGTYYRWAQQWATAVGDAADAPRVLSVGDLHVENFGTWRDVDGRLCWGVNDFDEADELPYMHDLVRLAVSVRFAKKAGGLDVGLGEGCATILDGYQKCLAANGQPFVLEEHHPGLRKLPMSAEREPCEFLRTMTTFPHDPEPKLSEDALSALIESAGDRREVSGTVEGNRMGASVASIHRLAGVGRQLDCCEQKRSHRPPPPLRLAQSDAPE